MKDKLRGIYHKIDSFMIYCYSFIKGRRRVDYSQNSPKTVLLMFFGKIGDMVMFLGTLKELKSIYCKETGYRLVVACRNEVRKVIEVVGMQDEIEFFEINREMLFHDKCYFFEKVKRAEGFQPYLILHIRQNDLCEDVYIHAISANNKLIYRIFPKEIAGVKGKYFTRHTYNMDFRANPNYDLLTCYADLMRKLGRTEYRSIINRMPQFEKPSVVGESRYVALCPGASMPGKCWPVERYAEVIDYILKKTAYNIVFCGGELEKEIALKILKYIPKKSRIINLAAKTQMDEWFGVIQNAEFVISNESAATHIAASGGVANISIGEQTYGDKWLPYVPEIVRKEDKIPVIVRSAKLPCYFCAKGKFFADSACKKNFKETGVYRCVYEVTVEMVIHEIDKLMGWN